MSARGVFLGTEGGENRLAGYRRAADILKSEERRDGEGAFADAHDPRAPAQPEVANVSRVAG